MDTFGIEGLPDTMPDLTPAKYTANPCVTIYKFKGGWAVRKEADISYIFPTLGTALKAAKTFIEEMEQGIES